jgi:hypothetical protein
MTGRDGYITIDTQPWPEGLFGRYDVSSRLIKPWCDFHQQPREGIGGMEALAKLISRSLALFIILFGVLSLPAIVTAGEVAEAARLQGQHLGQLKKVNLEFQKSLVKGYAQQARMRQCHGAVALAKRVAARAVKEKLKNERNAAVTERYNQMIHGSKIMRDGMMRAEAMLMEGPNHLAKLAKKVTASSEMEKGH